MFSSGIIEVDNKKAIVMVNIEHAKTDPSSVFKRPGDVVRDTSLSRAEKIEILRRWAYDEREMAVAEEENMQRPENEKNNILEEVLKSLLELGADSDDKSSPPTKQG
jgi:hypothetical protein